MDFGKQLIWLGAAILVAGLVLVAANRRRAPQEPSPAAEGSSGPHWSLGRLPGDIRIKRENFSFYFPLTTCIVLSVAITLLFRLFGKK